MAKRKSDTKSRHFSPASTGSKRKADDISSASATPLRQSTRVKKTVVPAAKLQDSGSEDEDDEETDYKEESEAEAGDGDDDEAGDSDSVHSVTIPIPKARGPGATPYEDDTIHPNTFLFLADLNKNNNREWLKWHDKDFRQAQQDFETFILKLTDLIIEKDPTIPELPKKDLIFRIYRDVRFSNDPTPYKPHFSAAWSRTGKKGPYAAYYLQIKPGGESFIGGGLWQPESPSLLIIRESIDVHPHRLKRALMTPVLRNTFFPAAKADEKKVVAAFLKGNAESALKTKPKGFDADHRDIALLRLRNFTMGKKIPDKEIVGEGGMQNCARIIGALVPWITYLNRTVRPDRGDVDTDDEE